MGREERLRLKHIKAIHRLSRCDATPYNLRECSMLCRHIAVSHFNQENFEEAGPHCVNGIDYLCRIEQNGGKLADDDYRNLIDLYLDLSDIYAILNNISERDQAIFFALKAFQAIQSKTQGEINIGDPNINFPQFYHYFQRQLCTPEFIGSSEYQNNESLISEDVQQKYLLSSFKQSFFLNQHEQDMANLQQDIGSISVSSASQPLIFVADTDDQNYRRAAASLQTRAEFHQKNQSLFEAINTYRQAVDALVQIRAKTNDDYHIIRKLNDTLLHLHNSAPIFFKPSGSFLSATMNDEPITEDMAMMYD